LKDLNQKLAERAEYFEKRFKFTQKKKNYERTRELIPVEPTTLIRGISPFPAGLGSTPSGPQAGTQPGPGYANTANPKSGKSGATTRAILDNLERNWRSLEAAVGRFLQRRRQRKYGKLTQAEREQNLSLAAELIQEANEETKLKPPQKPLPPPEQKQEGPPI
jgi:hypothetical protein